MAVVRGFEVLTTAYLGEDWDLFGATADEAIVRFARGQSASDVAASIKGLENLVASSMTEDELEDHWVMTLHGGYDPAFEGRTFRQFFAHALAVLRDAAGTPP